MVDYDIIERVRQVIADLFLIELKDIDQNSSIDTIEDWDSLQHINLIMSLEQKFGIRFDVDDAAEMISFPSICDILIKYLERAE